METKSNKANTVQDTIERYVYQVARRLPDKGRKDIEAELRGLIEDMLEARCGDITPTKKDVDIVLMELGSPAEFAAKYGNAEGKPRYLIGPSIFPQYLMILKIVLLAVLIGMTVVSIIQTFVDANGMTGFEIFGAWMGNITSGLFSAAACVTLIFAIFEWRGISMNDLNADWLSELPPVPKVESRFSRGECIFGIVFSSLFLLLFIAAPQYIAVYTGQKVIPLFDMELYPKLLPLIAASCMLGVCKEIAKLLEGRYTMRLAVGISIVNIVSIVLCIIVLSQPIWNPSLLIILNETVDLSDIDFLRNFWNSFGQVFLGIVLFGFVIDMITLWVHTIKEVRA